MGLEIKIFKNYALWLSVKIIQLFAKKSKVNAKHILIISNTAIGDTLWSTPALQYLAEYSPNTKVSFLTSAIGGQVLQNNPYIDNLLINNSKLKAFKHLFYLLRTPFSESFNFHTSKRCWAYWGYLGCPGKYYGIYPECKGYNILSDGIKNSEFELLHKIDIRILLFNRFLRLSKPKKQYYLGLYPGKNDQNTAQQILKPYQEKPLVFIQPGANLKIKKWHPEYFSKVTEWLDQRGYYCIFAGNIRETTEINQITKNCKNTIKLGSNNSLLVLASIIKQCEFVISNDTGPMHIAEALNKPIFSFFIKRHVIPAKPITTSFQKLYIAENNGGHLTSPKPDTVIKDIKEAIAQRKFSQ